MNLPPVSISLPTRLPKPFRLRKAAARRLAEAGCSANEIAAITGHAKLEEAARYAKAAEQKRLARAAIERLPRGKPRLGIPNLVRGLRLRPKTSGKSGRTL
jgi:hypothetical protein